MMKRHAILLAAVLLAGCQNTQTATNPGQVPEDAKISEAKSPTINAQTWYAAGQLAEASNQPDKAIIHYGEALKVDPKHAPSLYRLGVMHAQRKEFSEAVDAWKKYIKATDNSATGWGNLGFCYELMFKREEAEASYKKGIEADPKDQLCRVNYGLLLARNNQINEALKQFEVVLSPSEAHYNLGSVYEQQKKFAQAKLEYTRSLELNPTFFDAQQRLASLGD